MLSLSLNLPEIEVAKQEVLTSNYLIVVQKKSDEEHCSLSCLLLSVVHG
ncbi:hypothetical protein [Metabacillus niabensis]|nr:hypothetical protein [Metabacillus niabensis]